MENMRWCLGIEGNSTDDGVRQKEYDIANSVIFGYGTPTY